MLGDNKKRENRERWYALCQQASVETDSAKLLALVTEINNLLEEKERAFDESAASSQTLAKTGFSALAS